MSWESSFWQENQINKQHSTVNGILWQEKVLGDKGVNSRGAEIVLGRRDLENKPPRTGSSRAGGRWKLGAAEERNSSWIQDFAKDSEVCNSRLYE